MRSISNILFVFAFLLLATTAYDQHRGVTIGPTHFHSVIRQNHNPADFRHAMTYHWFFACLILSAGVIAYFIEKGEDDVDPMAPDSDPQIDEELREDEQAEMKRKSTDNAEG